MEFPWRKAKTPQQINREQKKQDNEAHSRMDSIYAELEQARLNGYNSKIPASDRSAFDDYFKHAILLAKDPKTVRFDTAEIDQLIKDSVLVLESAQGCGTSETVKSCFRSIKYGLTMAHDEIPTNAVATTTIKRRVDMLTRLLYIAQYSLDLDKRNDELAKQNREFETLNAEYRQATETLQDLIDAKPEEWKRLNELTDDPEAKLSGYQKEMVAAMDTVLHLQQSVDNAQMQIGAIKQANETQENVIRTLREQIRTAEYAIDENSVERIKTLTDAYVEDEVATQKLMDQMDECADRFNKAVQRLHADVRNKQHAIKTKERYQEMLEDERQKNEDAQKGMELAHEHREILNRVLNDEYEEENEEEVYMV